MVNIVALLVLHQTVIWIVLELKIYLVHKSHLYELQQRACLFVLLRQNLTRLYSSIDAFLNLKGGEFTGRQFTMRVVWKRCLVIFEVSFELAFEERLFLLFCGHVEQILAIRLDLMLHVVDDLLSDPPLRFSLQQSTIAVLVATIDDLPFQGVFLHISTLHVKGQISFGLIKRDNIAIDVVIGLKHPLHLLLIDLKKRIFAHKFMAVSSIHCSLAKIFFELQSLLTLTLLEVLVPYAIYLKIFGEFIHIEAILQLLPPLQLRRLQFQHLDQPLFPCLFVLKTIVGDPVPECEGIVEFAMEGKLIVWLLLSLSEVQFGVQGLFEVKMFLLGAHRRNIVLSICDYYVIEGGQLEEKGDNWIYLKRL